MTDFAKSTSIVHGKSLLGANEVTSMHNPSSTKDGSGTHKRLQRRIDAAGKMYSDSSLEHLWTRLNAMDFINKGMLFAAILLLCFFPFIIVANALAGQTAVTGLIRHLGLNRQAAKDVSALFTSSGNTSDAVTGTAYIFFILGGIAAATSVQDLYERSFDLQTRGMKDVFRRLIWLAVTVGCASLAAVAGPWLHSVGGPAPSRRWPDRSDDLLVVHHVVPAFRQGFVASPVPIRSGDRSFLGRYGGRIFDHIFEHCDLRREKVRPHWGGVRWSCPG